MLFLVIVLALGVGVIVTRTPFGREQVRRIVEGRVTAGMQDGGSMHIGRISGGLLTGFTIDTIAVRDAAGQLVLSAGRTTVTYDPRDLLDRRLLIGYLEVEHPYLHLVQAEDGSWNYKQLFRQAQRQVERRVGRRFGDFVVIDSARVSDATFLLTMPWHPADSLRGARRDSSIREHLARPGYRRAADGTFAHTYRWTRGQAILSHARIADPDSAGRLFVIADASVVESEPPFTFREVRATVRQLKDSLWLEASHFDTPGSTGRARGKVVWGSGLPMRYDVRVWGDSVSLADVAWVYPTLPTTGGGRLVLDIRNDPSNLRVIDYRLSSMDVRSTGSHLRGAMTFAVGGPVLAVKDVDVRAMPLDFDLIRTFAGGPFPVDWQGTLTGTVQARGGPLTDFVVDDADVTFRDRHVPGAVSRFQAVGALDILDPAFTVFRGLDVAVERLDLRTVQYLYPEFPPLGGIVTGVVTLDSSWLDVRFSEADIAHSNGPETPSRVTGSGRVTYGEEFLVYDLDVVAQPLSLPMMARAYPTLPLTGLVSGPIRARGTTDSLALTTELTGEGGTLRFDGVVDVFEPVWRARGTGTVAALDAPRVFTVDGLPATTVNGAYDIDLAFTWGGRDLDSLVAIGGRAAVDLDRSVVDGVRLLPSTARLRFADGRMLVDSLRVATEGAVAVARGGIGLPGGAPDSLLLVATVDSLGALRRHLGTAGLGQQVAAADSLAGTVVVDAVAIGRLDALQVAGTVRAEDVVVGTNTVERILGTFDIRDATGAPAGGADLRVIRSALGGIRSDSLAARFDFDGANGGTVQARLFGTRSPSAELHAAFTRVGAFTHVTIDTLSVNAGDHALVLAAPARVSLDTAGGVFVDSLLLRDPHHGSVRLAASVPATGAVAVDLRADSIAIEDIARVLRMQNAAGGAASATATVRGTRDAPVIVAALDLERPVWGEMQLDAVAVRAAYDSGFAHATLAVSRAGRTAIAGAVDAPVTVTFAGATTLPTDSIRGWLAADSTDLAVVEAFSPALREARGVLRTRFDLGGTWGDPSLAGHLRISGGGALVVPLGITLRDLETDLLLVPGTDSLVVRRMSAVSSVNGTPGTISVGGFVTFADITDPRFDLQLLARGFHAIERSRLAQLDVSTGADGLRLRGRASGATLTGTVSVDRGTVFIPDVRNKAIVELTAEDLFGVFDTTTVRDRGLIPAAPSRLVENLRLDGVSLQLGDDVWLRSREANVKLGGSLRVTRAVNGADATESFAGARADTVAYRLALAGSLNAERGTYRLDLGPVRREFDVESGTITFFGTPDLNPALDISAMYTVQQNRQDDIRVRARLTGFLYPQPTLVLESASGYALSQSDLISYLVTGRPSVESAFADRGASTAASVFLPSLGTYASQELREQLGGWVDQIRFETGTANTDLRTAQDLLQRGLAEAIFTSRLGGEKKIGENLFVSLSSGLCQLNWDRQASGDPELAAFVNQLAWRLEYRFPESVRLQAGREPSRSAYDCDRGGLRGVVNTPAQWAFTLSHTWRF